MSGSALVEAVLLALGVGVVLLCGAGLLVLRDAYDRLHCLGPATIVGPVALAAAVVVETGLSPAGLKAVLIAAMLLVTSPVLTHATARAVRYRQHGHLEVQPGEEEGDR